jgi:hypothetical protein
LSARTSLDLGDKKLIVVGGDVVTLSQRIRNGAHGGAWDGSGIVTSRPEAAAGLTSLGIATATGPGYAGGQFGGVSVASGDVLLMYTYAGDANLDGFISGDDYTAIDFAVAIPSASGWANGDFNHDRLISGDDYSSIDFNIVAQGPPIWVASSPDVILVPEPVG